MRFAVSFIKHWPITQYLKAATTFAVNLTGLEEGWPNVWVFHSTVWQIDRLLTASSSNGALSEHTPGHDHRRTDWPVTGGIHRRHLEEAPVHGAVTRGLGSTGKSNWLWEARDSSAIWRGRTSVRWGWVNHRCTD